MEKIYKVHPGIGIARVGKGGNGFFLQSESVNGHPFELSPSGEVAFMGYKDSSSLIRKQGVRFRVFEYEVVSPGSHRLIREITEDDANLNWSVTLGNSKAAGPEIESQQWLEQVGGQNERVQLPNKNNPRNKGIDRSSLTARITATASGTLQPAKTLIGTIMKQSVTLGEIATDFKGRLLVVGGSGEAHSWEAIPPEIKQFNNNNGWYDTVADGSVDVNIRFNDGSEPDEKHILGSWVIIGPPDFAPDVLPVVSLYDLIFSRLVDAKKLTFTPTLVSYKHHVLPILERLANLRWINENEVWDEFKRLMNDPSFSDPTTDSAVRSEYFELLKSVEKTSALKDFRTTRVQKTILDKWVKGQFNELGDPDNVELNQAEELDKATLYRSIGSGLFPGIEMGFLATFPELYSEPFRFTRKEFTGPLGKMTLLAGSATEGMALPWQADFMECNTNWWPAQRPDVSKFDKHGAPKTTEWVRGLVKDDDDEANGDSPESHHNMVEHYAQLGVIEEVNIGGKNLMIETGRDPNLPRS